jgi:hypothetical protein
MDHQRLRRQGKPPGGTSGEVREAAILEFLETAFPIVARYLGESRLRVAAKEFAAALNFQPGRRGSWFARFPLHLAEMPRFKSQPEIAELAQMELAFRLALDGGAMSGPVTLQSGAARGQPSTPRLHPCVRHLLFTQNTASIWSALICQEAPPRAFRLDAPQQVLVWQQSGSPRFRLLGESEARALAQFERRPSETSAYFRGWLAAGLVVEPAK